jgi:hypothetical protein
MHKYLNMAINPYKINIEIYLFKKFKKMFFNDDIYMQWLPFRVFWM